tara:strand:- start:1927 stop:2814 length:888 start_codon:yes stop_codon:yes gene_type:complete
MAYKKHPRHITKEQFADNTTVDGDRIDSAMESFERHINEVPEGDVLTKWTPTMFVAGWIPQSATPGTIHHWPWLTTPNISDWVQSGTTQPERFVNTERVKGYKIPGVDPTRAESQAFANSQWVWDTSFQIHRPAVVTHIDVLLMVDNPVLGSRTFTNIFAYGSLPPQGFANGDPSKDFSFCLHVDAPTSAENRQLNEIEATRNSFVLQRSRTSDNRGIGTFTDMTPNTFPGGFVSGVYEPVEGEIPLHQNARVRLSCVIPPVLPTGATNYDSSWGDEPWFMQQFGVVIHMLEEVC